VDTSIGKAELLCLFFSGPLELNNRVYVLAFIVLNLTRGVSSLVHETGRLKSGVYAQGRCLQPSWVCITGVCFA